MGHPMRLELTRVGLLTITPPEVPNERYVNASPPEGGGFKHPVGAVVVVFK